MSINRRNFIRLLGDATLLTDRPAPSARRPEVHAAPSDQLTKGIIGVGGIGKSSYHFTSNEGLPAGGCLRRGPTNISERAVALGQKKFGETLEAYERLPPT